MINHLSFADDIILFASGKSSTIKLIMKTLELYESTSNQVINKAKSCFVVPLMSSSRWIERIAGLTGMQNKDMPLMYLGCPLYVGKQQLSYFAGLISKITGKVKGWQSRLLSPGGRAILIKHVLLAMPMHLLASVHPPKPVLVQIEKILNNFFWGSSEGKDKHHWASWAKMCYPYSEGGVNFRRLKDICQAFLAKIWWNLRTKKSVFMG